MSLIYKPSGAALEYAPWALNPWDGCPHGCLYCYVPETRRMDRAGFHMDPKPRKVVLDALRTGALKREAEAHAKAYPGQPVLLSFSSDPYQPREMAEQLTRRCLEVLIASGCTVAVLTKAGTLARRDFDLLASRPGNWFGVTLTTDSEALAERWEPNAAPPAVRIENLEAARDAGISTWVSLEPTIYHEDGLRLIKSLWRVALHLAVGKLNRWSLSQVRAVDPTAKPVNWPAFRTEAMALLEGQGYTEVDENLPDVGVHTYYVKQSLREAA